MGRASGVLKLMSKTRLLIALPAVAALALGACATKPKPAPQALNEAPVTTPETPAPPPPEEVAAAPSAQAALAAAAGDRVFFAFDSYALEGEARDILTRQASWLSGQGDMPAVIAGSADERGTRGYNLALGARRAAAAREFLITQGVSATRLSTISYGKEQPVDPGSNEDAWALNRNAQTLVGGGR